MNSNATIPEGTIRYVSDRGPIVGQYLDQVIYEFIQTSDGKRWEFESPAPPVEDIPLFLQTMTGNYCLLGNLI